MNAENIKVNLSSLLAILAFLASIVLTFIVSAAEKKETAAAEERQEHRVRITAVEQAVLRQKTEVVEQLGEIKVQQQAIQGQYETLQEIMKRVEQRLPE